MDTILKELASRKKEIEEEVDVLFKSNMKLIDWDVPEADDKEGAKLLFNIIQKKLDSIQADIKTGKYDYY